MVFILLRTLPWMIGFVKDATRFRDRIQITPIIVESLSCAALAIINISIIVSLICGGRDIFKNKYYIIVANLIACSSLKTFVELAFVLPYFVMQSNESYNSYFFRTFRFFSDQYEQIIFNISVVADYGVLLFLLLIAVNRYLAVTRISYNVEMTFWRSMTVLSCILVWMSTIIITFLFHLCDCKLEYNEKYTMYLNTCLDIFSSKKVLLHCLINLSYVIALIILVIYVHIFTVRVSQQVRRGSMVHPSARSTSEQTKLLKQSAVIFAFYAVTMICLFVLSLIETRGITILLFTENVLNVAIAFVCPACLLLMPGELRSLIVARFTPKTEVRKSSRVHIQSANASHTSIQVRRKMVFILRGLIIHYIIMMCHPLSAPSFGLYAVFRDPDYDFDSRRIGRFITESLAGCTSVVLNLVLIIIMVVEGRKLFMSKWYGIVANLIVCTSLKSIVEVAFVIPYFIMQYDDNRTYRVFGYFSREYELFIFNLSVFADHGVLFFTLLIAVNRYVSITRLSYDRSITLSRWGTFLACCFVWFTISVITFLFNSCKCYLEYNHTQKMYYNVCPTDTYPQRLLLFGLIHVSYAIAIITMAVYARTFIVVRRISQQQRRGSLTCTPSRSRMKSKLLQQSALIFGLYAITIVILFALSFVYLYQFAAILFAENMLNLSIAIIYPICLISMPGELKSAINARFNKKSPPQNISNLRIDSTNVSMTNIPMHIMILELSACNSEFEFPIRNLTISRAFTNRYIQMVFVERKISPYDLGTGMVSTRTTGTSASMLIIESLFGTLVAISNIIIVIVIISGWKKLMKYNFYVIVANLTIFTSFKAFVELGFILPYYVMQADGKKPIMGYFSTSYELLIFNLSVLADYGVLFFSVLIAANRLYAVTRTSDISNDTKEITICSCFICTVVSAVIPLLLYFCQCQFTFNNKLQIYHNKCQVSPEWEFVLTCLLNLSYVCCVVVLLMYIMIFLFIRKLRKNSTSRSNVQMKLLKQSIVVFLLYAASILCVIFVPALPRSTFSLGDIAYVENLLNLSIAAVYPICLLVMSGEMKTILASKFILSRSDRVTSISANQTFMLLHISIILFREFEQFSLLNVMVFTLRAPQQGSVSTGLVAMRDTADHIVPLVIESSFAMTVALSNLFVIVLMVAGCRRLLKDNFYIILANLIFFTSLKAVVECAFVVPYYVMQRDEGRKRIMGYFSYTYEWVFFNLSVFADYGILFFSLLIALNRYFSMTRQDNVTAKQRLKTCASCVVAWICAAIIPVIFCYCECQFSYDFNTKMYHNDCVHGSALTRVLIQCLVYLSYAVAVVVLCVYARTFILYQREKHNTMNLSRSNFREDTIQLNLLKQSALVFALYAFSILCVLILSFVKVTTDGFSEICFAENLLNLSIAGIYPICFLCLSSELRRVLVNKIKPKAPTRVASISLHTPNIPKANAETFDLQ